MRRQSLGFGCENEGMAQENWVKDFKRMRAGDRLSCTTYVANALHLLLHAFAYRLLDALRTEVARRAPALGRAQFETPRRLLLKTAAPARPSVRRIAVGLPTTFPLASVFTRVAARLGGAVRRAVTTPGAAAPLLRKPPRGARARRGRAEPAGRREEARCASKAAFSTCERAAEAGGCRRNPSPAGPRPS